MAALVAGHGELADDMRVELLEAAMATLDACG